MEPIQTTENAETSRAKAISTGETPLALGNVLLGIPSKPMSASLLDKSGVVAQAWDYADIVSQKRLITTISVANGTSGIVWTYPNTWQSILSNFFGPLEAIFAMKSWTLNFEFHFQTNFQQVGQFNIFYVNAPQAMIPYHFNLATDATETSPLNSYLFQTQMPHIKVPMGEETKVNVQLKWLSPMKSSFGLTNFFSENATDTPDYDMGSLYLAVPWPMEIATGVTPNCSVRIWGYLSDVTYGGYTPNDITI